MLERSEIRSLLLFVCVEEGTAGWRFFDWRTRHTGSVDRELLVSLMEPLFRSDDQLVIGIGFTHRVPDPPGRCEGREAPGLLGPRKECRTPVFA